MDLKPRFYAHPANYLKGSLEWPYIMVALDEAKGGFWSYAKHVIIDCGVDKYFFMHKLKDYPHSYVETYPSRVYRYSRMGAWIVIPDYPDDYHEPGFLFKDGKDNVERTFENIERMHRYRHKINWIYPVQAHYKDLLSFEESLERLKEYEPKRIGIGTVCKISDVKLIGKFAMKARKAFPDAWIHAFGPCLRSIIYIRPYVDSFDSSAQFISGSGKQAYVKNKAKRVEAFNRWVNRLRDILAQRSLEEFI